MLRKLLYLLGGVAVGVAVARLLRGRRSDTVAEPASPPAAGVESLRAQLAASRTEGSPGREPAAVAEPPVALDVDEARRRVHGRARDTVEEMRRSASSG